MKRLVPILLLGLAMAGGARAELKVFACEPEWAALTKELGGERVDVFSATNARQDPHHIQARPSLIAKARGARLLVCTGADLEAGWLPLLLRKAANPDLRPGRPGHFLAAEHVLMLDIPATLDRAEGDIHPYGNPHIITDPRNVLEVARALGERLKQVDPQGAHVYQTRLDDFSARWRTALEKWQARAAAWHGAPVAVLHKSWPYLHAWLGLREVAVLEPKPGIPPSSAHLNQVLTQLKTQPAKAVLYAAYQDARPAEWLARETGIPLVELPYTVGAGERALDLFALFEDSLARLGKALDAPPAPRGG